MSDDIDSMKKLDKKKFNNDWYSPQAPTWKRVLWFMVSAVIFKPDWNLSRQFKVSILRAFGAKIGERCYVKPGVTIKYPWLLEIGDYVGLGEYCWIDNIVKVTLKDNTTLSQGAMLVTGNHDYRSESFALTAGEIVMEEGSWVAAGAKVGPGVTVGSHSVIGMGSVVTSDTDAYMVYQGNPAVPVKRRVIDRP